MRTSCAASRRPTARPAPRPQASRSMPKARSACPRAWRRAPVVGRACRRRPGLRRVGERPHRQACAPANRSRVGRLQRAGAMGYRLPGGLRGSRDEADLVPPLAAAGAHRKDVALCGARGLMGNAREMVIPESQEHGTGAVLVKGAGVGDPAGRRGDPQDSGAGSGPATRGDGISPRAGDQPVLVRVQGRGCASQCSTSMQRGRPPPRSTAAARRTRRSPGCVAKSATAGEIHRVAGAAGSTAGRSRRRLQEVLRRWAMETPYLSRRGRARRALSPSGARRQSRRRSPRRCWCPVPDGPGPWPAAQRCPWREQDTSSTPASPGQHGAVVVLVADRYDPLHRDAVACRQPSQRPRPCRAMPLGPRENCKRESRKLGKSRMGKVSRRSARRTAGSTWFHASSWTDAATSRSKKRDMRSRLSVGNASACAASTTC